MGAEPIHLQRGLDNERLCGSGSLILSDDVNEATCVECLRWRIAELEEAERLVDAARRRLNCVADCITEFVYQELASALDSPPRWDEAQPLSGDIAELINAHCKGCDDEVGK